MTKGKTTSGKKTGLSKVQLALLVAAIPVIGGIIIAVIDIILPRILDRPPSPTVVATLSPAASSCALTSSTRYGFDCGIYGWKKTDYFQNQAIQSVATIQFDNENRTLSQVLALTVDFTGTIDKRRKEFRESGEALVELNSFPPVGYETKSVDLQKRQVVAWVWAPKGSIGDISHKNGIRLFVKDLSNKSCYGKWQEINQEEIWFRIVWPDEVAKDCDSGFNRSTPKLLGISIGVGGSSNWTTNDLLTFYIDDINW